MHKIISAGQCMDHSATSRSSAQHGYPKGTGLDHELSNININLKTEYRYYQKPYPRTE